MRPPDSSRLDQAPGYGSSMPNRGYEGTRRKQLEALAPVLRRAVESGDRVLLAGDFNATSEADRGTIAALAAATGLRWVTEDLACSHFWERDDGCHASRLDQVLMSWTPDSVVARGPCETEGCDVSGRCPVFRDQVSDHCAVTIDYD
jgi:endonuclease/exonuclease/phosphatase family metal-dependent hydrolase